MTRSLLRLAAALALCVLAPVASASAGAKSCLPNSSPAKSFWHKSGVQVYTNRVSRGSATGHMGAYACSNVFRRRYRIEPLFQFEAESLQMFRTNGRFLFYKRRYVGPTSAANFESGRLIDLKTGHSMRNVAATTTVGANVSPSCVDVCRRSIKGAAIGPRHSFVIGFNVVLPMTEDGFVPPLPSGVPATVIEMHCASADLSRDNTVVLDTNLSDLDVFSIKSSGTNATWTHDGKTRSAKFC